ncbi:MAG: ferritin-like domain-containing protein [Epsilonproteobacteria bacterium]|nr:ferritin-like domain-containing protein [Campylobacterota bacterium]
MQEIDYSLVKKEKVEGDDFLFKVVTTASFIEITSDVYKKNLSLFYQDNPKLLEWLEHTWEKEELQHGKALKKYVKVVWDKFDWEGGYEKFKNSYLPLCTLEEFQPTKAKEMLARMVVETGTSTFYKALSRYAKEKGEEVLAQIAQEISKEEVYHYEQFFKGFKYYNQQEQLPKNERIKVIYQRLKMVDSEDGRLAFKAILQEQGEEFNDQKFEEYKKELHRFAKKYYPYKMAIKMLLQPLELSKGVETTITPILRGALKLVGA